MKILLKSSKFIIYIFFLVFIFFVSCKSSETITNNNNDIKKFELSKNAEQEYYYLFLEANRIKLLGDYNSALLQYYKCLEINPLSAVSMSEISQINEQLNNYPTALKYAKMAVETEPDNKWYQYHLAQLYLSNKDYDKAIEVYSLLHKSDPNNHEVTFFLASLFKQVNRLNEALELYNEIEEKVGVNETTSIIKQQIYFSLGNKTKAYYEINNLITHFPSEPRYYGILAEMYTRDNYLVKAEEAYNKLFEIDSINPNGQLSIVDFYRKKVDYEKMFQTIYKIIENENIDYKDKVITTASLLNSLQEVNLYESPIKSILETFKIIFPDSLESHTLFTEFYIKTLNYDSASSVLELIINKYNVNELIWEQLISIYSFQNKVDLMYQKSSIAIDSFPNYPTFYLFNGISAVQLNKTEEAINVLKKGLSLVDKNKLLQIDFFIYLGEAYQEVGNYKNSDYYFQEVLKEQPDNYYVINNYSYYLSLRNENLEYAETISKKTVLSEPTNSTYLDTYAWILYKLSRYDDALIYIKKAIEFGGLQNKVIVEHFGDILYKTNNTDSAVEMWKLAKNLGNNSINLEQKIINMRINE